MHKTAFAFLALAVAILLGCAQDQDDTETRRSLAGANDRIQALIRNIKTLEGENAALKQGFDTQSRSLKATYDRELQTANETNRQKVAGLEEQLADLRMALSVSEKQRLALQEVVDQPDRVMVLRENNFAMERVVWISLLFISAIVSICFAVRYHGLRKQRRENIVRVVSELSNTGGPTSE